MSTEDSQTPPPPRPPGIASRVLALIGPLLVFAVLLGPWLAPEEEGEVPPAALAMDEHLQKQGNPDVLILGASLAHGDIDVDQLSEELPDEPNVVRLHVNATRPPTWYAILKNRVYAKGYKPKVVVVVDLIDRFFVTESPTTKSKAALLAQMAPDDVVILNKTLGQNAYFAWLSRMQRRRDVWREDFVEGLRDFVVGAVHGEPDREPGEIADQAVSVVFDEARLQRERAVRVIPVVETTGSSTSTEVPMSESYVPDMVALAQANGAKIVFVNAPLPPSNISHSNVPVEYEARALALFNELGAGWIDMQSMAVDESEFADMSHMNARGAQRATSYLADVLTEWNALGDGPLPKARLPLVPSSVQRIGTVPAIPPAEPQRIEGTDCAFEFKVPRTYDAMSDGELSRMGVGGISPLVVFRDGEPMPGHAAPPDIKEACAGMSAHTPNGKVVFSPVSSPKQVERSEYRVGLSQELPLIGGYGIHGWWVYPGTTVEIAFDQGWTDGPFAASLIGQLIGEGADKPIEIEIAGQKAPIQAAGALRAGVVEGSAPSGPWKVRVTNPEGAPFVVLRSLSVGQGDAEAWVIGGPADNGSQSVRFIGRANVGKGRHYTVEFDEPPPPVTQTAVSIQGGDGQASFDDDWIPVQGELRKANIPVCAIVDVWQGKKQPKGVFSSCKRRDSNPKVSRCQQGRTLIFDVEKGTGPADYELRLHPSRRCVKSMMLYPGDSMAFTVNEPNFAVGADTLEVLVASAKPPGKATIAVRLESQGRVFVDEEMPLARLIASGGEWKLPARLSSGQPATLFVETSSNAPWTIIKVASLNTEHPFEVLPPIDDLPEAEGGGAAEATSVLFAGKGRPKVRSPLPAPEFTIAKTVERGGNTVLVVPAAASLAGKDPVTGQRCGLLTVTAGGAEQTVKNHADKRLVIEGTLEGKVAVTADDSRRCGASVAVYPNDRMRILPLRQRDLPAGEYELVVALVGDPTRPVNVQLRHGKQKLFADKVDPDVFAQGEVRFPVTLASDVPGDKLYMAMGQQGDTTLLVHKLELVPKK